MFPFSRARLGLEALDARDVPAVLVAPTDAPEPVAGWGSSSYQYAFAGTYANTPDGKELTTRATTPTDSSAVVFVGGWGASSYQYAFQDPVASDAANPATRELINDFVEQDKYVTSINHGVSVLAWARVDGTAPATDDVWVDGKIITAENYDS